MNNELLDQVLDHLRKEPKRLAMNIPVHFGLPGESVYFVDKGPSCGTVGCIAGWGLLLKGINIETLIKMSWISNVQASIFSSASAAFELTAYQAERLFLVDNWPLEFRTAYNQAQTPQKRFEALERRVRLFQKTEGIDEPETVVWTTLPILREEQ